MVLCVGDSSINVFLKIPENSENVSVDAASRLMNFRLGSKTQLENETVTVGGNALNVAVGLARQGIGVELVSIVGDDNDGNRIINFLNKESEKLKAKSVKKGISVNRANIKTNVGYAINYKSERFLLIDTSEKDYCSVFSSIQQSAPFDWLFLSSISSNYANFFRTILEYKKSSNFKLAYNPSSNELKKPVESYVEMIKASDILFVNKKEMIKIVGGDLLVAPHADRQGGLSLQKLWELSKKLVVVTDGDRGSYAYDGQKTYFEPSSGIAAIEKTGAGDAYESGFLAEYLKTGNIQSAMKNGTENAGSVIQKVGPVEGLLYKM